MAMFYTDYEISAPDKATMMNALAQLGFNGESGFVSGGRYSLSIYGEKWMPTGSTTLDAFGKTIAVKAPVPGYYALLRWLGASVVSSRFPPGNVTLPAGLTSVALPANSPVKFET